MLHLQWTEKDGTTKNLDCDISCPAITTSTPYDGRIAEIKNYLREKRPVGWIEELRKLENMRSASNRPGVKSGVMLRLVNRRTVLARQVRGYITIIGANVISSFIAEFAVLGQMDIAWQ